MNDRLKVYCGVFMTGFSIILAGCRTVDVRTVGQAAKIGYWRFDGNGTDQSGKMLDLNLAGDVGFMEGRFNQALSLHNDMSQFAVRPTSDELFNFGLNDFTIQVWVNFNNTLREQTLIEKFSGAAGPGWTLTKLAGNALHFYAGPTVILTSDQLTIPNQTWHHILVRRSGERYQILFNGCIVAEGGNPGPVPASSMPLLIGKRNQNDGRNFAVDGQIDEVAIWSRSLSDAEISLLIGNKKAVVNRRIDCNTSAIGRDNGSRKGSKRVAVARCMSCGKLNELDSKFCSGCGGRL
jgi:hypothetical protein